jgi:dTDP-4-dehydrorhamnose 3,5-epimerase
MKIQKLHIEGPLLIEPAVFHDSRGYFYESYNGKRFRDAGIDFDFVQDNVSLSSKNVLRGLHFQMPPFEQGKLVSVVSGSVLDVIVDIRSGSPTFGKNYSVILDAASHKMLWIPPGFAHGFLALEDNTMFFYKCTAFYDKASEKGILWNDSDLAIDWGIKNPLVSDKDMELMKFRDFAAVLS